MNDHVLRMRHGHLRLCKAQKASVSSPVDNHNLHSTLTVTNFAPKRPPLFYTAKFHVFAHTKITVKCRPGAQRTPIDAMPLPGAGSGGGAGVHGRRSPTAYKRSPLSTPVQSAFETPMGSEWSYGYGELQRQQQLPPLAHFYQPEQATPHHYPQPHTANLLSPSRPSTPSVSAVVVETTYNALVMERLGEDVGTIFRRHLLKHVKPSAVPTLSKDGTASSFKSARRRPSACDTAAAGVRGKERVGWDEETIAWLGCHALKRLEWVHSQGLVHRDIVSPDRGFAVRNLLRN